MNTQTTLKLAATLFASTSLFASFNTSAASLNDVYKKVQDARTYAVQARNHANTVRNQISGTVTNKLDDIQDRLDDIPAKLDELPKPAELLGQGKEFIEDNVTRVTDELQRVKADFDNFKGNNCDAWSECGQLKQQILNIYSGLTNIQNKLPNYDVLPLSVEPWQDPNVKAIENIPPMVLFGISTVTGPLNGLDDLENIADWVNQLRFYTLVPVEEDQYFRLPVEECATLEDSIQTDSDIFGRMNDIAGKIEIVSYIMKEVMPKDIVINAWVGTSIPNPALPVAVVMNKTSSDFQELIEKENEARRDQVKACRTQDFRMKMLASAGY